MGRPGHAGAGMVGEIGHGWFGEGLRQGSSGCWWQLCTLGSYPQPNLLPKGAILTNSPALENSSSVWHALHPAVGRPSWRPPQESPRLFPYLDFLLHFPYSESGK